MADQTTRTDTVQDVENRLKYLLVELRAERTDIVGQLKKKETEIAFMEERVLKFNLAADEAAKVDLGSGIKPPLIVRDDIQDLSLGDAIAVVLRKCGPMMTVAQIAEVLVSLEFANKNGDRSLTKVKQSIHSAFAYDKSSYGKKLFRKLPTGYWTAKH